MAYDSLKYKAWYLKHRKGKIKQSTEYQKKHRKERREYHKRWRQRNLEKYRKQRREYMRKYRATKKGHELNKINCRIRYLKLKRRKLHKRVKDSQIKEKEKRNVKKH